MVPIWTPATINTATALFLKTRETIVQNSRDRQVLRQFRTFMEASPRNYQWMTQVRFSDVTDFCSTWKLAIRSKVSLLTCLVIFLRYCHREDFTPTNLGSGLSRTMGFSRNAAPKAKEPFTCDELESVWQALAQYREPRAGHKPEDVAQLAPFIYLMRYTGMEISATVMLAKTSVRGNQILTHRLKNGSEVWTIIPEWLAEMLWTIPHSSDLYFFTTGQCTHFAITRTWHRRLRILFSIAGLPHRTPQNFRHYFAVEHLLNGTPMEDVSRLLGHSDVRVTLQSYGAWMKGKQDKLEQLQCQIWESDPWHQRMKNGRTESQPC